MSFWSPSNLNQMVGNANSLGLLRAVLANKSKAPRAYLFEGPHGCGKNVFAKLFAKELVGDTVVVSPEKVSSTLGQEDLDEYPCLIWDHAERMTREQAEQLATRMDRSDCKTVMIFLTVTASKVEQSIRARTLKVQCGKLSTPELSGMLSSVCAANKILFEVDALNQLAKDAQGVPSVGLVLLEAAAIQGPLTLNSVNKLQSGIEGDAVSLLTMINAGADPLELASKMKDAYALDDIIDSLFETYAKAFLEGSPLVSGKLSNYKSVGNILLKWKSAQTPPVSALFILVQELVDCNEAMVQIEQKTKQKPVVDRDRGMTGAELDELILSGGKHGDSDIW